MRWLRGEVLPGSKERLLCLAGALDLDPCALWNFDPSTFPALCDGILAVARGGRWHHWKPAFGFLHQLVRPSVNWPPLGIAKEYFGRSWVIEEREYAPKEHRDLFQPFLIEAAGDPSGTNQIWHFAWRPRTGARWQPYGFVQLMDLTARLFAFSGATASEVLPPGSRRRFCVETWLGRGPAQFRIASLHPFTLTSPATSDNCAARVRFD